jgi:hypothetical protein
MSSTAEAKPPAMSGIRGLHLPTGFRVHLSFAKFRNATPGVMKANQDVSSQVKSQTFTPRGDEKTHWTQRE